ncbi:MAG: 4-(cytidine 5'-diphospho)-2-C-methyl-D-erythritol kinase, partial [Prevotellaceae bacterium]|nr:4-(cytidine 5'-diphospho)-2-C-methyl-D-erythritol kinase [Prevotellaceae bacterium]
FPIAWSDVLEVLPSDNGFSLNIYGISIDTEAEKNLCTKAFCLLEKEFKLPAVHIYLQKNVPFGAGLGGGSSNAAFTLIALNKLFGLNLSKEDLASWASVVGSDCAFFIHNQPMIATEKGDILEPININLSGYELLIVKPSIAINTAQAYSEITPKQPAASLKDIISSDVKQWKDALVNDFESSIFSSFPELVEVKQQLYNSGALYASMSGSGSALFGIFERVTPDIKNVFNKYVCFHQRLE